MKKFLFFLFTAVLFTISSCKKDRLTKATQTGANTFSCKVDGKIYLAQIQGVSFSGAKPITVHNFPNGGFTISTIDSRTGETFSTNLLIHLQYLKSTGIYTIVF